MARIHHEVLPLGVPVLLCAIAWAVMVSRPAVAARFTPSPRARVELPRAQHRPPSPPPREAPADTAPCNGAHAAETPAPPGEVAASTVASGTGISGGSHSVQFGDIFITGDFDGYDGRPWEYSEHGLRWQRWHFYHRRAWEARRRAWREARDRRVQTWLTPGDVGATEAQPSPLCEVFSSACNSGGGGGGGGGGVARVRPAVVPTSEVHVAEVRRDGRLWKVANGLTEVTINPDALCAITVERRTASGVDVLPGIVLDAPTGASCAVAETMAADSSATHGSVALSLTWVHAGVRQQAVVSLADDATGPELNVTRSSSAAGDQTTLINLTSAPLTWTIDGREVTVQPAQTARVGG